MKFYYKQYNFTLCDYNMLNIIKGNKEEVFQFSWSVLQKLVMNLSSNADM
jgi:hypothetical protein